MHNAISVLLFSCLAKIATRVHGVVHGSPAQGWVMMHAGGGLGEGCSADNDFDLPAEMSIHLTCLEKFPEYINLTCRGELVRYFREQR